MATVIEETAIPYTQIALEHEIIGGWKTARIRLSSPEASNCVTEALAEELRDACERIGRDDECRLLTFSGTGNCFSEGRNSPDRDPEAAEATVTGQIDRLRVADSLAALNIPVLVALNGNATGHGLELALAGDLRIAVEGSKFALWLPGQPAYPWDGGTQRLPRLVGMAWAMDMALTGRCLDAHEALQIGLVNRVVPRSFLEDAVEQLALAVLKSAPVAARYGKEAVRKGSDLTLEQGLRLEADLSILLQSTDDRAEGIKSFGERRKPEFKGK